MKVYQLIYTSVLHSLSDEELGLENRPGQRVYSCSQGVTRDNIAEIVRFSSYRLPKDDITQYSKELGDPEIPQMFPKAFRTLRLADGRFAAIQSVYAGCDINGEEGNFFAHALIFEDFDDKFFPEQYYGSEIFRTYLTKEEQASEIVRYMPVLENPIRPEGLDKEVKEFIKGHKKEITYILNQAVSVLVSDKIKNICINTEDEKTTAMYLISLKYLLPREISRNTGISTYNVYLPSEKHERMVFHGVVSGKNNITEQAIETRQSCLYIDFTAIDCNTVQPSGLLAYPIDELRSEYSKYGISSVSAFNDWFALTQNITFSGMGGKLIKFKKSAGDEAFATRAKEIFADIDDESMRDVKFEITKVMYDNISLFPEEASKLTEIYITDCITKLCMGENYSIDALINSTSITEEQVSAMYKNLPSYMDMICDSIDTMGEKNRRLIMSFLTHIKHAAGIGSWAQLLNGKKKYLTVLLELALPTVVSGYGAEMFSTPDNWSDEELYELIAYIEAATEDKELSMGCLKYITEHDNVDWTRYGITIVTRKKSKSEIEEDSDKVRSLLRKVGYEPFQRQTYQVIKRDIMADVEDNRSPLLISKLLAAVYTWQGAYGDQRNAQLLAEKVKKLILELREKEPQCYNFMFPKLGIEIIESQGHYHETMINTSTMPPSFWSWFLIGAKRSKRDDKKMLAYIRIYSANKLKLNKLPVKSELRKIFRDEN